MAESQQNRSRFKQGFRNFATPSTIKAKPTDILFGQGLGYIPWTGWTDETKYTSVTVWTSPLSIALSIGVTLYANNLGSAVYSSSVFVYNNTKYIVESGIIVRLS